MKKCFPFLTTCGSQLDVIDKRHSNLLYVPDEVSRNARSIEECFLDANQIKDLPKNFFKLSKIRVLTLSDNELTHIPESIGNFNHLVELDVSRNHIDNVHYNIRFCNELRSLDLSNNPINRLPEGFSSLRNLTVLNLNDNSLTELPNDFGNLSLLQKLELRDNCLKTLPNSFSKFIHLELLDLGGNEFQEFPKSLAKLTEIRVLCLDNNELTILPQEMGTLKNLQQLDVSENFLEVICEEIGNLEQLTDFVLSQNSVDCLPNNIGHLKELTVLKVDQNKLMSLTNHIGNCSKLQELYLTENLLTKLPGSLGKLSKLVHLNADRNSLSSIPPELSKCNELSIMSFRDNHIRRLPDEIGNMKKLHVLDVSINQLDRLPLSIAQCPLKALWLSENQSQSMMKLQRDRDETTLEEFLTCYLLPQSGIDDLNHQNVVDTHNYASEFAAGDRNSQVLSSSGADNDSINIRVASNTWDPKVRFNEDESTQSNRISKELPKTRHPKFDKKAVDGHIIPKDIHVNKENKFAPNRFGSDTEQADPKLNGKVPPKRTKKISDINVRTSETSDLIESHDDGSDSQASPRTSTENQTFETTLPHSLKRKAPPSMAPNISIQLVDNPSNSLEECRLRSHSDAGLRPGDIPAISEEETNERANTHSSRSASQSSGSSGSEHALKNANETVPILHETKQAEAVIPEIKTRKPKPIDVTINDGNLYLEVSSRASREQTGYSSGGEEIDGIARHVGFSDEIEDNEEASDLKLIRRDTPHYTKKSKIQQITSDGVKNEDVVKQIMEKLRSPSQGSGQSITFSNPRPERLKEIEPDNSAVQMRHMDNIQVTPTYDQVVSASALARGSDVPPGLNSATSDSEEVHIIIERLSNEPLGMSIAGGKGSNPYQPVFVSRVTENGAANRCGLRVNDKIISVNNQTMNDVDHAVAVSALKTAGNYIDLLVLREVVIAPPPLSSSDNYLSSADQNSENIDVKFETIKCEVVRDENGLGFSIAGGKGSMRKEFCDQKWAFLESIYICKITPYGAADKCKKLQVGDKIIKINGIDVSDARHDQAVVLLSGSEPVINLEVQRQIIISKTAVAKIDNSDSVDISRPISLISPISEHSSTVASFKDREVVKIIKTGGQLGLSICGGIDHYSHPFGIDQPGVFISKISPTGAAKACGKLLIGDRIVSINGHDVSKATHDDAILHILQANNEILLEVIHEPPPPGLKEIVINKGINEKLGINIHGGNDGLLMNPDDLKDRGIFITKILPDSAVYKDGKFKVGDRLIEVNRRSFMGLSISAANNVLRSVSTQFCVLICDGVGPEKIDQVLSSANYHPNSLSISETKRQSSPSPRASLHINSSSPLDSMQNSPQMHDLNAHSTDFNNYIPNNQITEAQLNDREHLSFRSKRLYFEKEIEQRKSLNFSQSS